MQLQLVQGRAGCTAERQADAAAACSRSQRPRVQTAQAKGVGPLVQQIVRLIALELVVVRPFDVDAATPLAAVEPGRAAVAFVVVEHIDGERHDVAAAAVVVAAVADASAAAEQGLAVDIAVAVPLSCLRLFPWACRAETDCLVDMPIVCTVRWERAKVPHH